MTFKTMRMGALAGFGAIVLAVGMMGASVAPADQEQRRGDGFKGRGPGGGADRVATIAADLNLDEQQRAYFEDVQEFKKAKRAARRDTRGSDSMLQDVSAGGIDARTVHTDIDTRFESARTNAHAAADARIAFLSSLDDDQLAMLAERRADRAERKKDKRQRKGKRGRRGPGGQGGAQGEMPQ
jgi:hypothetical protein